MQPPELRKHTQRMEKTVYQLFNDEILGTRLFNLKTALIPGVPRNREGFPLIGTLHLLPSVVQMIDIEIRLRQIQGSKALSVLYRKLMPILNDYDYILLDCPPNLHAVTQNALIAAQYCVVPFIPDSLSLSGFEFLVDRVNDLWDQQSAQFTVRPKPQFAAFIINHYEHRKNVFAAGVNEFEIALNQIRPGGKIHSKAACLKPFVRFNVHVAESTSEHLPVVLHKEDSIGAEDYISLTTNFVHHFETVL
jgi:chromosome partitioning protein